MSATAADLPDDVATLKAMVLAGLEREARMQHIIDQITRTTFGKRLEKLSEDQLALAFYRQAQALVRQGIEIDRGTMCNWAGRAAGWLGRLTGRMKADLLTGARLFVDETTAKVLAPGTGKVKTGYLWVIARDDGAHGGTNPPAVAYTYMPGRGKVWAERLLGDFTGIVQCDRYGAYKHIEAPDRKGGPGTLSLC
jgi:hypothetical protein